MVLEVNEKVWLSGRAHSPGLIPSHEETHMYRGVGWLVGKGHRERI